MSKADIQAHIARFAALPQCVVLANYTHPEDAPWPVHGQAVLHAPSGQVLVSLMTQEKQEFPVFSQRDEEWGLALATPMLRATLLTEDEVAKVFGAWSDTPVINEALLVEAMTAVLESLERKNGKLAPDKLAEAFTLCYKILTVDGEGSLKRALSEL